MTTATVAKNKSSLSTGEGNTKRERILFGLKKLALKTPCGITRASAASALKIDLRTAAGYLEQLTVEGFLKTGIRENVGKGRPGMIYFANTDKLSFLGVVITQNMDLRASLVDCFGNELQKRALKLPESGSRLSIFSAIRDFIWQFHADCDRHLYGAGLAISRWLQPPLAGEDVYANLTAYLKRELNINIYRDVNINAVAYKLARKLNCQNLAVVHLGQVLEFGLVLENEPDLDFARRETFLSHTCVNPRGRRCYCGKYGCLENYVTSGALKERLHSEVNPAAVVLALGEMLASALVRVARKYPVENIVLLGAEDKLFKSALDIFMQRAPRGVNLSCYKNDLLPEYGAALEALQFDLQKFM